MTEMQWTQLSAELKAAETSPQLLDELCERIKQLTTAAQESEVPKPEEPANQETPSSDGAPAENTQTQDSPF